MLPHTSASTCFSGPESIFVRLKILIFGEFSFLNHLPYDHSYNQPDLGLFLFDVGSDVYNGKIFIDEGNLAWGLIIFGVICLPMIVVLISFAIYEYRDGDFSRLLFIAPVVVLTIPIATVAYIGYVAYVFARKFVQPGYIDDQDGDNQSIAGMLKLVEAVAEANLQAVLGSFISLLTIIIKAEFVSLIIAFAVISLFRIQLKLISFDQTLLLIQ